MVENKALPNIIIFVPDEMRGDTVSLEGIGNPIIKTPNIDQLAKEGVAFTKCFTVNPVCVPSRCCIFTGQYIHSNGHRSLYQLLQPHEENLFKFLKNQGYEVIWIGRNDLFDKETINLSVNESVTYKDLFSKRSRYKINPFPKDHRLRKSFYFGERTQEEANDIDYYTVQKALEYLDSNLKKPFCLYIAIAFPHPPYTVEEPYFSMYDRESIPSLIPPKHNDKPEFMHLMYKRYGLDKLNKEDYKEIIATYYGMISKVDFQFGQIITKLKEIGEYDNSAILFFADHGDFAGDYGLTEKWPNAFQDCLINIPLIIKIPGIKTSKNIYENLVSSIDIFPTIMDIARVETLYTHFGKSLIPLLQNKASEHRDAIFAEGGYNPREPQCFEDSIKSSDIPIAGIYFDKTNIPKENPSTVSRSAMIRTKKWKLIIRDEGKEELYDLLNDPNELENLIDDSEFNSTKIDLKERLLRWYLRTSDNADWKRRRVI